MNRRAFIKYIVALLLFGSNGIVASRIALSSMEIVYTRTFIGSVFLLLIFFISRQRLGFWKNRTHALSLLLSGMAMGASWMFLYEAYKLVGVSLSSLAYYTGPVIVMILTPLLFRERMGAARIVGFVLVLVGMLLVNGLALSAGTDARGLVYGGLSALMYSAMVIFNKKARSISGLENPLLQLMVSFLTVAVFVWSRQGLALSISPGNGWPILLLGVVNTGLGCYFYFSSIGALPMQTVAVLGYLEPLSALVFSALFLGESLVLIQIIGAMLILGGAAYGELASSSNSASA